jgi:hypothetical protein
MKGRLVHLVTLLLLMLTAGIFWGTWFSLTRSIAGFSSGEFIHIGKVISANIAVPMKLMIPGSLIFLLVSMVLIYRKDRTVFYYFLFSFLFMLLTLIINFLVEVQVGNQIKTWTAAKLPENWHAIRERWAIFHAFRTFCSLISFFMFALGIVAAGRNNRSDSFRRSWLG